MSNKNQLLIFTKNPIPGTVKTRISKEKGNNIAIQIYKKLLLHTREICKGIDCEKTVYFNKHIENKGLWSGDEFNREMQVNGNLGTKMSHALKDKLVDKNRAIIIGSDNAEIRSIHIEEAFEKLDESDIVIGPASDGGYYLLGMNKYYDYLFQNMPWSSPELLVETQKSIVNHGQSYTMLKELSDIDYWQDWKKLGVSLE